MKKLHIFLLVLVAVAVAIIFASFADFSSYETFATATAKPNKKMYVVAYLEKDKEMVYDPLVDKDHFSFYAKDKEGTVQKVIFTGEKPRDIEKSEQLVMTGYDEGGVFHCSRIQMKCPSKYKKDQVAEGRG